MAVYLELQGRITPSPRARADKWCCPQCKQLAGIRGDSGRMVLTPAYAWLEGFTNSSNKDIKEDSIYLDYYDCTVTLLWWDDDDE